MIRNVTISKTAKRKIEKLFKYLVKNWNLKVKTDFAIKLNRTIKIIQLNPEIFPESTIKKGLHKCVITKQTVLLYRFNSKKIIVVTIFDARQNPNKLYKDM